jgi:hypothetical protein
MKKLFGLLTVLTLSAQPAFAADVDVSCTLDLKVEIKQDKGNMEYVSESSVHNNSGQVFTRFKIQIVDAQGKPIGKTYVNEVLFPGDSASGSSKWSGGQYIVNWDADPSIKSKQLDTFEAVRTEKMAALNGAKCILTAATKR